MGSDFLLLLITLWRWGLTSGLQKTFVAGQACHQTATTGDSSKPTRPRCPVAQQKTEHAGHQACRVKHSRTKCCAAWLCRVFKALDALSDANMGPLSAAGELQEWGTSAPTDLLPADRQNGSWHNYLVGVEGIVGECSVASLWPNMVWSPVSLLAAD